MKLITTNNNQCVVAAFAMAMNTTIADLILRTGNSGNYRILDNVEPPECNRSWHPEEFVDLLLADGYATTMISFNPSMIHGSEVVNHTRYMGTMRFFGALRRGNGVIFCEQLGGRGHAVAWNCEEEQVYDPKGRVYELKDREFNIRQFYLIKKVQNE